MPGNVVRLKQWANDTNSVWKSPRAPLAELDDRRLMLLCRAGDELAWEHLVLRYQRLVYSIPVRMGLPDDDADDVFLETFARLVEWIQRVEHPKRVRAWLVTTARRLSLDAAARHSPSVAFDPPTEDSPLERISRAEEVQLVNNAMASLAKKCQDLLGALYGAEPARYREISRRFSIPIGSIGPTRARCLDALLSAYLNLSRQDP